MRSSTSKGLLSRLKRVDRKNKRLKHELLYMDKLFRLIGFPEGLESLKQSAEEMKDL